ncbi:ribonuclease [Aurantiacibacter zhengii]|uniref:Ribonuclease n=1 Tax=Aurantiacibacter zhengii TaxID=2307003 RepID=A0A418NUM1_9SPHN|nr:ribonuclease [Aurantiacibacter zhengii]RIV87654.1 ribonuclease [Aurantiacibacter zhengii]
MAEWLVEEGIGEERAVLFRDGEAVATRHRWPGELQSGTVADGRLIQRSAGSARGMVSFEGGQQALVKRLPANASEGASYRVRITRPAIHEQGRSKWAQAEVCDLPEAPPPSLAASLAAEGHAVKTVRRIPAPFWVDAVTDAYAAGRGFAGGSISLFPTPAMTLIDVDGDLAPRDLALAAVPPVAEAIALLDIGGNIGIDFPTLPAKADRRAVDQALDEALASRPHERTAMNGFGFVQIVARLERISLLHRARFQRPALVARQLLRDAEHLEGTGRTIELTASPAVIALLAEDWLAQLRRRSGREVALRPDPALAIEGCHAQIVP